MTLNKGAPVAFTVRGFRLEGTVVRVRKSDGKVTVDAPVVYRMADGTPMVDYRESMLWDIPAERIERMSDAES